MVEKFSSIIESSRLNIEELTLFELKTFIFVLHLFFSNYDKKIKDDQVKISAMNTG
jgi:hypothetical protein